MKGELADSGEVRPRPPQCPVCGATRIAAILHGMPAFDAQLERDIETGRIVLGGCCVSDDMAEWRCGSCAHEWATALGGVLIDEMKKAVHDAAGGRNKIATFHLQVLMNAGALEGMDVKAVCKELGVPATYATEFRKMLSLARLMRDQGIKLAPPA